MNWVFITPLAIGLTVAYLFKNATDEGAYLAGSVVLVNLLVSLVIAPWEIKALLLIVVVLISRRLLQPQKEWTDESSEEKKIELTYRGAKYETTAPDVEVSEGAIAGKYRGKIWRVHELQNGVTTTSKNIKYRGAQVSIETAIAPVQEKEPSLEQKM